jgi:hypothetical protein
VLEKDSETLRDSLSLMNKEFDEDPDRDKVPEAVVVSGWDSDSENETLSVIGTLLVMVQVLVGLTMMEQSLPVRNGRQVHKHPVL